MKIKEIMNIIKKVYENDDIQEMEDMGQKEEFI